MFSSANVHLQAFTIISTCLVWNWQFSLLYIKPNSCWSSLSYSFPKSSLIFRNVEDCLRRALLCAVLESLRAVFQNKLQVMLQMLILKSQHFLPPITLVLIPETFTAINNTMPLRIKCILIKFIPNWSPCKLHLSTADKTFCHPLVLGCPP